MEKRPERSCGTPQLKLADTGDNGATLAPRAVEEPKSRFGLRSPLEAPSASCITARITSKHIWVREQNVFDGGAGGLTFSLGHGGAFRGNQVTLNTTIAFCANAVNTATARNYGLRKCYT